MKKTIIGIDLGGTNLRIGAVSGREILFSRIIGSECVTVADEPIRAFGDVIEQFMEEHDIRDIEAISVGVPSSVANDKETVICTTNLLDKDGNAIFRDMNIAVPLKERFRVPVFVNKDTNNILLYDIYDNHLEHNRINIGLYFGTGIGDAVFIDGESLDGANGAALDLGHIPFFKGTEPCSCSKTGCCECYASGWKLQKLRKEYYPSVDIKDIFNYHAEDEPLKEFVYSCAYVVALTATIFNPNAVVLGGGVIEMKDFPIGDFERQIYENTGLDVMQYGFDLIYSKPFSGRGIIGAALFAETRLPASEAAA